MRVATIITHLYLTLQKDFLRYFHVSVQEATAPFISFHSSLFFSLHIHFVFFLISYAPFSFYHFLSPYTVSNYVLFVCIPDLHFLTVREILEYTASHFYTL